MGGFDLFPAAGIDLDAFGLEWVRTYFVQHRATQLGYRMIQHEDLDVILGIWPSERQIIEIYGRPGAVV
jgi:hypothetical protein